MGNLNLPPIQRKPKTAKKSSFMAEWNANLPPGWHFSTRDVVRFESMGLNADIVRQMTIDIGIPTRVNLSDYIYSARMAGVDPKAFIEIAKSGVMNSPPPLTALRQYLGACHSDPLLAMLALRAKLSPQELTGFQEDGELTVQNLRAMIDLGSK